MNVVCSRSYERKIKEDNYVILPLFLITLIVTAFIIPNVSLTCVAVAVRGRSEVYEFLLLPPVTTLTHRNQAYLKLSTHNLYSRCFFSRNVKHFTVSTTFNSIFTSFTFLKKHLYFSSLIESIALHRSLFDELQILPLVSLSIFFEFSLFLSFSLVLFLFFFAFSPEISLSRFFSLSFSRFVFSPLFPLSLSLST